MMDVEGWLRDLGLTQYAEAFRDNDIDAAVLAGLTAEDLRDLGVASVGHRRKLLDAIAALQAVGAAVPTPPAPAAAPPTSVAAPAPEAERRQLTVMFVDLVGSTALSARLDPEEMGAVLRAYQNAVAGEIARLEGHVAKFMGDGVLAYFGWPRAHEDEAERAVRAGLAIVAAVARLSGGGAPLACRVGLATGLVVVGELIGEGVAQEQTVVGETPNLAARLQALAAPGQVVVGESTRRLLGGGFVLADLGVRALKGIEGEVAAFAVTGERALASRFEGRAAGLQPMVGRDQELALLLERWAQAEAGEGQAVLLVGEAGVGKSRISRALLDALGDRPHLRIRYQCSPYHTGSALWPAIQQLEHAARFAANDPLETRLDKLEAALGGGSHGEATSLIADLLGIDGSARYGRQELTPQARRARTLEALTRQLLKLATTRPVLLLIEDAHWADPTTLELIEAWLDATATARVLLVLTSRPDNQPALGAHPHVTRLSLNRLGRAGVEAIVARLGGDRLPPATVDAIIARTDGVPLYVEELTKAVLETGEAAIPASLHDSLMARLDRTPEVKEIAQIAACIGREFDYELLAAVAERAEAPLTDALEKLAAAELVFRRGTPPDARYTFKHALVRDAAYESLLRTRRRELHGRVAEALQHRFPQRVSDQPELLARHFTEAQRVAEAIPLWQQAGERAARTSANVEAIAHLTRALELLATLPESEANQRMELETLKSLGPALIATHGFGVQQVKVAYEKAWTLCERLGTSSDQFPILRGMWNALLFGGQMLLAKERGQNLLRLAERSAEPRFLIEADRVMGTISFVIGEFEESIYYNEMGVKLYDLDHHRNLSLVYGADPSVACLCYGSLALWMRGYPSRAKSSIKEASIRAKELSQGHSEAIASCMAALLGFCIRDHDVVDRTSQLSVEIASKFSVRQFQIWPAIYHGWAKAMLGDTAGGIRQIEDALASWRHMEHQYLIPHFSMLLAEAEMAAKHWDRAEEILSGTLILSDQTSERFAVAECHRLRAAVSLQRAGGDRGQAEAYLHRALEVAVEQKARSLELRAARDLAALWAERGERQRALDLLAPIYDWFTEGFDTPDLVEAKALLEELR